MEQFLIEGGHPLSGDIKASGNKNAAIKMIPACLLTDEPVILRNVPNIGDVRTTLAIMRELGAEVIWTSADTVRIHARSVTKTTLDASLAQKIRASVVFAGPLLARCSRIALPVPGGDSIGERRLDTHALALRALGAEITLQPGFLVMTTGGLTGADILLNEASVTATENAIMAAVRAKGTTIIRNAACEPHVENLCAMLSGMGARIHGAGTNRLEIEGVETLTGGEYRVSADYMEVGSLIGAAVMTNGDLWIREADPQYLDMIAYTFGRLGVQWETIGQDLHVPTSQQLSIESDLGGRMPTIRAQPWPAFPPDLMSIALVIATQSAGAALFHDWMYESRFFFTDKLVRMGARITLCDPHRVVVQGPSTLHSLPYITSPDIRAGMALLLAALSARGETRVLNIQQIDRGYERVDERLRRLGANITRMSSATEEVEETVQEAIQHQ